MLHDLRGYESEHFVLRANNLQPKTKQLSVVLTTVDTTKQGDGRAECFVAIADDYAACEVGREVKIQLNRKIAKLQLCSAIFLFYVLL